MSTNAEALARARQFQQAGQLDRAEKTYLDLLAADPSDLVACYQLGVVQLTLGRAAEAEARFRRAMEIRADVPEVHADLGIALAQQGRAAEAVAAFQQALRLRPEYPEALSNLGVVLNQVGRAEDAAESLLEAVRLRPDYAEAYNNLGTVFAGQMRLAEAAGFFRKALEVRPNYQQARVNLERVLAREQTASTGSVSSAPSPPAPDDPARVCNVRGISLAQQGHWDEAVASFQEALRLRPGYTDALNNLGNVYYFQGKLDEAVACYEQVLRVTPHDAGLCSNLSEVLRKQGKVDEALAFGQRAVAARPDFAQGHSNLGLALMAAERFDEAIAHCREAVRLRADFPEAHHGLGYALLQQRHFAEAAAALEQAVRFKPDLAEAHSNLGAALTHLGRLDEGIAHCREALRLNPELADAHAHLAHALWQLGRFADAEASGETAVRLKPENAGSYNVLGVVYLKEGKIDQAVEAFGRAVDLKPELAEAHFNRAVARLVQGDWERGWAEYEWRWRCKMFGVLDMPPNLWDGSPLAGRSILLHAEQGLGDTLMFVRYAPLLKEQGATVYLASSPPLIPLLTRCHGIDQLVDQRTITVSYDVQAPLLSLPGRLKTTLATIPADIPYLFSEPNLDEWWGRALARFPGFKVGIAWQGSRDHPDDRRRSVPVETFAPLARPGVQLISLQQGYGTEQLAGARFPVAELSRRPGEIAWTFLDTAAVMKNLDLVITVDTAVAHLAGGLGVPTWVAVPSSPDWRWQLDREDSPWYPTLRLFRQKHFGRWDDVFERMAGELARLAGPG